MIPLLALGAILWLSLAVGPWWLGLVLFLLGCLSEVGSALGAKERFDGTLRRVK